MELQAAFETRRSIRHYDPEKKVTKGQVETLIKAASLAPSWKNTQTSRYYCILSEDKIEEVCEKCLPEFNQKNSAGAGALIVTTFVKVWLGLIRKELQKMKSVTDGDIMILDYRTRIFFLRQPNWD